MGNLRFHSSVKQITHYGHLIAKSKLMRLHEHYKLDVNKCISSNDTDFIRTLANTPLKTVNKYIIELYIK